MGGSSSVIVAHVFLFQASRQRANRNFDAEVNADGVVYGNSRCTLAGIDPNRVWHDPNPILHPVPALSTARVCSTKAATFAGVWKVHSNIGNAGPTQ